MDGEWLAQRFEADRTLNAVLGLTTGGAGSPAALRRHARLGRYAVLWHQHRHRGDLAN